ncbi:MAG: SDR family oxidoreductase [Armatimonadetes bacterium]|nr:SDR family oxidoreductase [Armatimonadota bacterium]
MLENRVAIVTGAARGLGKAIALCMATEGASVVICDVDPDGLELSGKEIERKGSHVLTRQVDVRNKTEVEKMVDDCLDMFGRVDILVNNAGILRAAPTIEIKEEDWDFVMEVNLKGTFLCSQAVLKHMMDRKYGRIVNMSSLAGRSGGTLVGASYSTSKAGILGFTRTLAKEVAAYNITVNAVAPGNIETDMTRTFSDGEREMLIERNPMHRFGAPGEVASLVCFLASEEAGYITGATVDINGGLFMA